MHMTFLGSWGWFGLHHLTSSERHKSCPFISIVATDRLGRPEIWSVELRVATPRSSDLGDIRTFRDEMTELTFAPSINSALTIPI